MVVPAIRTTAEVRGWRAVSEARDADIRGLASYALLRQLGMGRLAALAGTVLYQFNGTFAWFSDMPIMPIPFLPLLILGIEWSSASADERQRGGRAVIAIALAYSLYAGFPETAFLNGLLGLLWAMYRVAFSSRGLVCALL